MIEEILLRSVAELGVNGLLLLGLYWILIRVSKTLSDSIRQINHNSSDIRDCVIALTKKLLDSD